VVADAGYGEATEFRDGLEARHLAYVVGIAPTVGVWTRPPKATVPPYTGRGQPPTRYTYDTQRPMPAKEAVAHAEGWKTVRWRHGTKGWLTSRFLALRVQPSHGFVQGAPPHKAVWLLAEWPAAEPAPTKYWLGDLPPSTSLRQLVRVAKSRWAIEQDYQQLKEELGLDHYEGRGWIGWHHHLTLVMLAHAFLTLETRRRKKNFWVDAPADAP
jgi:SRSO17 transposase